MATSGPQASERPKRKRGAAWNVATAYRTAVARIREAGGGDLSRLKRARDETPVAFARRMAECAAPADMRLSLALGLGTDVVELELYNRAARLKADLAHKRLAVVGLRAGETLEDTGVSDRFEEFLQLFTGRRSDAATTQERP